MHDLRSWTMCEQRYVFSSPLGKCHWTFEDTSVTQMSRNTTWRWTYSVWKEWMTYLSTPIQTEQHSLNSDISDKGQLQDGLPASEKLPAILKFPSHILANTFTALWPPHQWTAPESGTPRWNLAPAWLKKACASGPQNGGRNLQRKPEPSQRASSVGPLFRWIG
jgi:hypothetical protein